MKLHYLHVLLFPFFIPKARLRVGHASVKGIISLEPDSLYAIGILPLRIPVVVDEYSEDIVFRSPNETLLRNPALAKNLIGPSETIKYNI